MHRRWINMAASMGSLLFGVFLVLPLTLPSAQAQQPNMDSRVKKGDPMPHVEVKELNGSDFDLGKLRGKVVVVNFWATWCGPCMLEMPRLEQDIWNRYKAKSDFAMVAIAREQDEGTVEAFQHSHPAITFPLAVDPHRTTYALFADAGIPRTYLVGRDGRVVYETLGGDPADFARLENALEAALGH